MSKKANHIVIGFFVLGAIAVSIAGFVVLSAGAFFQEKKSYVLYFEGDISGLDVGAPLDYKGVTVGKVTDISIIYDHSDQSISVPIIVELEKNCFHEINGRAEYTEKDGLAFHIKKGLRAQLKSQSMVTGKLKVSLVYDKNKEAVFREKNNSLPEIPTIPGALDSMAKKLNELPFEEIVIDIQSTTKALSKIVNSDKITEMLNTVDLLAKKINALPFESIVSDIQVTSKAISSVAASGNINKLLKSVNSTLLESHELMVTINKESRPFKEEMLLMMEQLGEAAEAIKNLSDYIERHPESLIHGKGKE